VAPSSSMTSPPTGPFEERIEQNNPIHPVVRLIKNSGTEEAGYIQAMAVFKREPFPMTPGERFPPRSRRHR
jgi:hypothetical protein